MSALLPLRRYQREALDALVPGWEESWRQAIILPTGGGKTVVFSHGISEHLEAHPGTRVLVLVHTDELVRQAVKKIKSVAPHLVVGVVKAKENEVKSDVIVASVQTLRSAARRAQIHRVSLIVVDECHHATARTYLTILEHFGAMGERPTCRVLGFTATLERGDGGPLGMVWQRVAFQRDIPWMMRKRFLVTLRGKRVQIPELDLSKVRTSGGDFREGDLGDALVESLAPEVIAKAYLEHAAGRKALAFLPTVASAEVTAQAFRDLGVDARVIHGGMTPEDRRATLAWHKPGTVLLNCMILTEGFDDPEVDCIIMGRPTKSKPLYIQIVGRGLRVDPARPYDEQDCLLLDVVGASSRMDLRSMADLSEKPVKEPKDGQTLLDLEDEFDSGEGVEPDEVEQYAGPVEVKDFDPIAAKSSRAWLKTDGGTYFLPGGRGGFVFLAHMPDGTYSVAWVTKTSRDRWYTCNPEGIPAPGCSCGERIPHGRPGGLTEHAGMDLEMAMTWGEDLAVDMGADPMETLTRKAAPWRKKPASEPAKREADRLGIKYGDKIKGGELSDLISRVKASARIDPVVDALVKQASRKQEVAA